MTSDLIAGFFFGIGFAMFSVCFYKIYENYVELRNIRQKRHDDALAQLKADVLNLCDEMKKKNSCTKKA